MSHNIIIPPQHQAAPEVRYDAGLARAAAEIRDGKKAQKKDWERYDWEMLTGLAQQQFRPRSKMRNQNFDAEFEAPGHRDPLVALLEHRGLVASAENNAHAWVEQNLELWELNCEKAENIRFKGMDFDAIAEQKTLEQRWADEHFAERFVRLMHPHKVFEHLRRAGVDARLEEHPNARIWLNDWSRAGLIGINCWVQPMELDDEGYLLELRNASTQWHKDYLTENWQAARAGRKVRKTVTTLQYPYGPEWSIMRFDEHGTPTRERYRGWRTAMLALIVTGVVTEQEVDKAFGPAIGDAGEFYRRQCQVWRQIRIGSRPV